MNTQLSKLLNQANEGRAKIYYRLNQLESITGLCSRSLKYRMKFVKEKYNNVPSLLHKEGRSWKIHHTLISEFLPIYSRKETTVVNHPWETMITWNTLDRYDVAYHTQLLHEVKQQLPEANIAYVVEKDGRGVNHVHAIVDTAPEVVGVAVENVLERYISKKDYRAQVEKLHRTSSTASYIRKNGGITII